MKPTRATLQARAAAAHLQGELGKLADFILANMPGEPSSANEGAADTAIRLLAALPAVHKANEELLTRCKDLETRLDDASQACNDYVATIEEHAATIEEQKATIARLEGENARVGRELTEQLSIADKLRIDRTGSEDRYRQAEKRREAAESDNNFLRDQLMGITRQNADLAGQLAVLREFAPVSEQQKYRDGMPRLAGRMLGGGIVDGGAEQATPWYHRRG